ncbi:recombinase family protein [Streptomyces olivochromogenes]|uniref:recombinase family protein n=1 Tax=Streptomyces olivochromogenes TaxID=1963 RepID=UPI0036DE7337
MQALRIASDATVTEPTVPDLDARRDGQSSRLQQNLAAWALASAWRGMTLYPLHGPAVITGRTQDGGVAPQDDDTAHLLTPVQAVRTGDLVGYVRVSTKAQLLEWQIHALTEAGCIRIFADKKSGKNAEREELWKALDLLREGDTLIVPSLDRLGRSSQDLIAIVSGLCKRGIGFTSLHEALDTTTLGGRLVFHAFAVLAEFIRELIVQSTNEGLNAVRARGGRLGRSPAMTDEQVRHAAGTAPTHQVRGLITAV